MTLWFSSFVVIVYWLETLVINHCSSLICREILFFCNKSILGYLWLEMSRVVLLTPLIMYSVSRQGKCTGKTGVFEHTNDRARVLSIVIRHYTVSWSEPLSNLFRHGSSFTRRLVVCCIALYRSVLTILYVYLLLPVRLCFLGVLFVLFDTSVSLQQRCL